MSACKTIVLASGVAAAEALVKRAGLDSSCVQSAGRCLGTYAGDGKRRAIATCEARDRLSGRKALRLQILQAAGAETSSVHKAGPATAWLWGSAVAGMKPSELHRCSVAAVKAAGKFPPGASLGLSWASWTSGWAWTPLRVMWPRCSAPGWRQRGKETPPST